MRHVVCQAEKGQVQVAEKVSLDVKIIKESTTAAACLSVRVLETERKALEMKRHTVSQKERSQEIQALVLEEW